ncbi:MarR family transcriptional regulator [Streptomyces sp. RKND-216]|uniref:MarR family winged helix-turn-helix transcriptional regulator n=1 Tax=Streptomyces sp. RKND-216 TaxID=2562581 RepID=UPI00109DFB14|nr:MarR family transcriptional regulator [Streptomyces sp. RKND-216]THA25938.1 MarR family transcriptional regulator [Streptomyces sp. RKND-216]
MGAPSSSPQPSHAAARAAAEAIEMLEVLWERGFDAASPAPVSAFQLRVLYSLDREEGINLRRLGELLDSRASSVSRLCDRLEATGYVERRPSPVSRRELQLHLTRKARTYLTDLRARREEALLKVLDRMPAQARRDLARGLESFRFAARGEHAHSGEPPGAGDTRPA